MATCPGNALNRDQWSSVSREFGVTKKTRNGERMNGSLLSLRRVLPRTGRAGFSMKQNVTNMTPQIHKHDVLRGVWSVICSLLFGCKSFHLGHKSDQRGAQIDEQWCQNGVWGASGAPVGARSLQVGAPEGFLGLSLSPLGSPWGHKAPEQDPRWRQNGSQIQKTSINKST